MWRANSHNKIDVLAVPLQSVTVCKWNLLLCHADERSDDEQTLFENRMAFKRWYLRPRVMRSVSNVSTVTTLFGTQTLRAPIFTCPAGVQALCHKDGECATALACGRFGTLFGLSQHATKSIEDVSSVAPNTLKWYQCYILKDRKITIQLVQRAIKAGYKGIILTVDSVRFGAREADKRNGFSSLPPPHRLVNYDNKNIENTYNAKTHLAWDQNSEILLDETITWDDIRWLKRESGAASVPLVVKGIMTAEDAMLAIEAGADGIMVSNHGGRQLDGCLAPIDALPDIAASVRGRVPILLDSGIRRGTDVLKALALGATAVGVGKPVFFSLAVGGEDMVLRMLQQLQIELETAMALCGCQNVTDINSSLICRHPSGGNTLAPFTRSAL